jgi:hypothetical protein
VTRQPPVDAAMDIWNGKRVKDESEGERKGVERRSFGRSVAGRRPENHGVEC